jgi:riboflavin biosynthesis pyrimidine reductase
LPAKPAKKARTASAGEGNADAYPRQKGRQENNREEACIQAAQVGLAIPRGRPRPASSNKGSHETARHLPHGLQCGWSDAPPRWRPKGSGGDLFERVHDELAGDAWLVGRVTGQEFARGKPYSASTKETFPREPWFARRDAKAYGVVLDAHGKIGWGRSDIGGDPIVVVLSEAVSDAHLAGLRGEGVSYIFAGKSELDLALALDILNRELGVKQLLLEGGGGANGAFLRAGLVDELNLILCPAVDGAKGAPSVFDSTDAEADRRAPVTAMTLESSQALEGGAMLLRYRIQNADIQSATGR